MTDSISRAYSSILPKDITLPDLETVCCIHSQEQNDLTEVFQVDRRSMTPTYVELKQHDDLHNENAISPTPDLEKYVGFSRPINNALHEHSQTGAVRKINIPDIESAKQIESDLSGAIANKNFTVYTGLKHSPFHSSVNIGGYHHAHMPAFVSTSTHLNTAEFFAGYDRETNHNPAIHGGEIENGAKHVLKLHITPGANIGSVKNFAKYDTENEMLLNRGYNVMVNPRPTRLEKAPMALAPTYVWDAWLTRRTPKKL